MPGGAGRGANVSLIRELQLPTAARASRAVRLASLCMSSFGRQLINNPVLEATLAARQLAEPICKRVVARLGEWRFFALQLQIFTCAGAIFLCNHCSPGSRSRRQVHLKSVLFAPQSCPAGGEVLGGFRQGVAIEAHREVLLLGGPSSPPAYQCRYAAPLGDSAGSKHTPHGEKRGAWPEIARRREKSHPRYTGPRAREQGREVHA